MDRPTGEDLVKEKVNCNAVAKIPHLYHREARS